MSAAPDRPLHDLIPPELRGDLAAAFLSAMRGTGWGVLAEDELPSDQPAASVAWALAKAELHYLETDFDAAVTVIDNIAGPAVEHVGGLPTDVRAVVEEVRMTADLQIGRSGETDHARRTRYWDRQRQFGRPDKTAGRLRGADRASHEGRNYDSLPVYTAALRAARRRFRWSEARQAARDLVAERAGLRDWRSAAHAVLLAADPETGRKFGGRLRGADRPEVVAVCRHLLNHSHLLLHRVAAAEAFIGLGDAVPEEIAAEVLGWSEAGRNTPWRAVPGLRRDLWWKLAATVVPVAGPDRADLLLIAASDRLIADGQDHDGAGAALAAAASACSAEGGAAWLDRLGIDGPPPPVAETFLDALLRVVHEYEELKPAARSFLFTDGRTSWAALQVAEAFGAGEDVTVTEETTRRALRMLRWQVVHAPEVGPVPRAGGWMIQTLTAADGNRLQVSLGGGVVEFAALARNASRLSTEVVAEALRLALDRIIHPDNACSNIADLLQVLPELIAANDDAALGEEVADVCVRFAADHRAEEHPLAGRPRTEHPLNAFRFAGSGGWPQQARAAAIVAGGRLDEHLSTSRIVPLIAAALADSTWEVRAAGFSAAKERPACREMFLPAAVAGFADSHAHVVTAAAGLLLADAIPPSIMPSLVPALERQQGNGEAVIRHAVHYIIRQIGSSDACQAGWVSDRLTALRCTLEQDGSKKVREGT